MIKIAILAAGLVFAAPVLAAEEKIDPATYICAELLAASATGEPPIFEALQIDGYVAGKSGSANADPDILPPILDYVAESCSTNPEEKALPHWVKGRVDFPPASGDWNADKTTCADYNANPDDYSGFVIWLDGYNRGKTGKSASIFADQATLDRFLAACAANPKRIMLDVLNANAR